MGRPSKLNPELQQKILQAIKAGNYAEVAAQYAGIDGATFYRWMARGSVEQKGIYREFREAVKTAEAESEVRAVAIIQKAMPDNWAAAMTYLERKYPARWKRREQIDFRELPTARLIELADEVDRRIESAGDLAALEGKDD